MQGKHGSFMSDLLFLSRDISDNFPPLTLSSFPHQIPSLKIKGVGRESGSPLSLPKWIEYSIIAYLSLYRNDLLISLLPGPSADRRKLICY